MVHMLITVSRNITLRPTITTLLSPPYYYDPTLPSYLQQSLFVAGGAVHESGRRVLLGQQRTHRDKG